MAGIRGVEPRPSDRQSDVLADKRYAHVEHQVRFELTRTKSTAYKTVAINHYATGAYV